MYYYKRQNGETKLIDYQPSNDLYDVEENIIRLLRKEKNLVCKEACNINTKYTGTYTIYEFGYNFVFITSEYVLNADNSIDNTIPENTIVLPPIKQIRRRRRRKKNEINTDETKPNE